MQTLIARVLVSLCCFLFTPVDAKSIPLKKNLKSQSAQAYKPKYASIVIDARTGQVLASESPDGIRHPASLTKMMTLYIVFEALKSGRLTLNTEMVVSAKASRQSPSKLGLVAGEKIKVGDAIMGLVTKSANDVAVVIAEHLGGSEEAFARRMTQKAHALKMTSTVFKNASGLPNPGQITTARDMAKLSQGLFRDFPREYRYFRHQSFTYKGTVHHNHNHLLGKINGLDGIKTGFIAASGFNIAVSAERQSSKGKHRLIAVVLGGENRHWRDRRAAHLLETNFENLGATQDANLHDLVLQHAEPDAGEAIENTADNIEEIIHEVTLNNTPDDASDFAEDETSADSSPPEGWVKATPATAASLHFTSSKVELKAAEADYLVQVGQFHHQSQAKAAANKAKALIKAGRVEAVKVKSGGKPLYAARLSGLSNTEADSLCKKWPVKGQKCKNLGRLQ